MQLSFPPELNAFRAEVRAFVREHLPPELAARNRRAAQAVDHDGLAWQAILARKGWSVPRWPVENGGTGWSPLQHFIFDEECEHADAPSVPGRGLKMCGPVICTFGTPQQKERFLEPIRTGNCLWAQGFSEPGAGSDLASLRTRAVREGDHYVVTGQKIWTTGAYHADWGFFLVRTNPDVKPQLGISFLLIDLKNSPGLTIRRIPQMNGSADVCEVFLDNVRVPVDQRVGDEGQGWTIAKFLLDHERTATSAIHWSKRQLARTRELARIEHRDGRPLLEAPDVRDRLLRLEVELTALEWSVLRVLAQEDTPYPASAAVSALKLRGSALQQAVTELQMDLLGTHALRAFDYDAVVDGLIEPTHGWPGDVQGRVATYLGVRAATIYGGSVQVQRGIVAKLAFNL